MTNLLSFSLLQAGDAAPASTDAAPASTTSETTPATPTPEGQSKSPTTGAAGDSPLGGMMLPIILFGFLILMFVMSGRGRKKQAQKFEEMYSGLKRDDRVMLQNGKFVVIDEVKSDRVFVWADAGRHVREEYHKNAVSMLAKDAELPAKN